MERKSGSGSAAVVALFRALETLRSEPLLMDPLAASLSPPLMQRVLATDLGRRALLAMFDPRFGPGRLQTWVALRHRWIDDRVRAFLSAHGGRARVLILGAGFDTRFMRLGQEFPAAHFVEVDHPATQEAKRQALERAGFPTPSFVALDFSAGSLTNATGLAWDLPVMIVWEGVTMYLEREAIAATLGDLSRLSQPGSELVCDFRMLPPETARSVNKLAGLVLSRLGEPLRYATEPTEATALLAESGWRVDETQDATTITAQVPGAGRRSGLAGNFVLHAVRAER